MLPSPRDLWLYAFLVGSLSVGCAPAQYQLYDGEALAESEVARIRASSQPRVRVLSVDSVDVSGREWEVLPGPHTLVATSYVRKSIRTDDPDDRPNLTIRTNCSIKFLAVAGREYVVTRSGGIERTGRDFYNYELAVFVAEESAPETPIGSFECEEPRGNVFP